MKLISASLVSIATLWIAVSADFELYRVDLGGDGITGNVKGWQVYQDEANRHTALNWLWRTSDDVSGGKFGVRCQGDGCYNGWTYTDSDPADIELAEMNFNHHEHHWSKSTFVFKA
jgi:hypothetical protein